MTYVDNGNYTVNISGSTTVSTSYTGPSTEGDLGICSCYVQSAETPSSITSFLGNKWCLVGTNVLNASVNIVTFVCWSMLPGTETVTVTYGANPNVTIVKEYSYSSPAYHVALQPQQLNSTFPYYDAPQGIIYDPLSINSPVSAYYNPQSGGSQSSVTVTIFLDLIDNASSHSWFPHAGGTVRKQANFGSVSIASGENTVSSGGTQTDFICQFEPYFLTSPTTPATSVLALMVVEA
jgi:hypothetical protein